MAVSFAVPGWIGTRIYQEMPPIPDRVVTTKVMRPNTYDTPGTPSV
jgi:nitric oxide reductase large subunit